MIPTLLLALLCLQASPSSGGEIVYLSALESLGEGDVAGAVEQFEEVAERFPDSPYAPAALSMWAETEEQHGDAQKARALYERLLEDYPSHRLARTASDRIATLADRAVEDGVTRRFRRIKLEYAAMEAEQAILEVEALIAVHPEHAIVPEAECWLGSQYRFMRRPQESRRHYLRALEFSPDAPCALRALDSMASDAIRQRRLGDAREAIGALEGYGAVGQEAAAVRTAELSRAFRLRRVGYALAVVALLGAGLLAAGIRWRELGGRDLGRAMIPAALALALLFLIGAFGAPPFRALLLWICPGALATVWALNLGYLRPAPRLPRWIAPPAALGLVTALVYGALYFLGRL